VALMGIAIVILAVLPVVDTSSFRSAYFKPLNLWLFWFFLCDSFGLGWIGQEVVETPFIETATFFTLTYFLYFIALLPFLGFLENAIIQRQIDFKNLINYFNFKIYK
jgi:ubiquinol-cytochrome c reductase cytochrome b subunit